MRFKAAVIFFTLVYGLTVGLSGQSLAELAKKEKERRAKLKGKSTKVITNADLKKIEPVLTVRPTRSINQAMSNPQNKNQRGFRGGSRHPTGVLSTTQSVLNPDWALRRPDGRFAQIEFLGFLDLEFSVSNVEGNDFAVYARRPSEGIPNLTWNYYVYAQTDRGEWQVIGMGRGMDESEQFDLGDLTKTEKIRIVYKDETQVPMFKQQKLYNKEYSMGIDAVEVLR